MPAGESQTIYSKFFRQFGQHLTDTFTGQCFFIAGLRSRQHKQVVAVLILIRA